MEWYVYRFNINSKIIEEFNIFKHGGFREDFEKLREQKLDAEQFAERLDRILMYYFWCKYEHEVLIGELTDSSSQTVQKVDIYSQVKMNWSQFLDYVTGRTSPFQIGDKLWYSPYGGEDPYEVTVRMLTQRSDGSWKIRVVWDNGRQMDVSDTDVGIRLFRDKEDALLASERECRFHKLQF